MIYKSAFIGLSFILTACGSQVVEKNENTDKAVEFYAIINYKKEGSVVPITEGPFENIEDCIKACDNIVVHLPDGVAIIGKPRCEVGV